MHIKPLTSLRFVFALMVLLSHLTFLEDSTNEVSRWLYKFWFSEGYIGVSFFFMLSGFILSHVYHNRWHSTGIKTGQFYLARIARIYPLHLITLVIAIPLEFWNLEIDFKQIATGIMQLTLLQAWVPVENIYFSFNGPAWSLSVEAFLYLLFPFLSIAIYKVPQRWIKIIFVLLIACIPLLMVVVPQQWTHWFFYINPATRLVDFIIGIAVYQWVKSSNSSVYKGTKAEIAGVLLLLIAVAWHHEIPSLYRYSVYYWLPMAFLIAVFYHQQGVLSSWLSSSIAVQLGKISFSFYLFHQLIYRYVLWIVNDYNFEINDWLFTLVIFIISLVISYGSFKFIETPTNRWLRNKWQV